MSNHVHLLFKSGHAGRSSVMRELLTGYPMDYNRRHARTGHLFDSRSKSIRCDEGKYLLALVRDSHLNPLRAQVVTTLAQLDRYPWCGHRAVFGQVAYPWLDTAHVLAQFGRTRRQAVTAYRSVVGAGLRMGYVPELTGGGLLRSLGGWSQVMAMRRRGPPADSDERILGSGDFVTAILQEADERPRRQIKHTRGGRTSPQILDEECPRRRSSPPELKAGSKRRPVSNTRATIADQCREELGASSAAIARHLGVNTSCIVRAIERAGQRKNKKHN
jgi:hypothetical protein